MAVISDMLNVTTILTTDDGPTTLKEASIVSRCFGGVNNAGTGQYIAYNTLITAD